MWGTRGNLRSGRTFARDVRTPHHHCVSLGRDGCLVGEEVDREEGEAEEDDGEGQRRSYL